MPSLFFETEIAHDPYRKREGEDFNTWRWRTVWVSRSDLGHIKPSEKLRGIREYLRNVVAARPSCETMGCSGCVDGQITKFVRKSLEMENQ